MSEPISINLGTVDYASLVTDEDYQREAKRILPNAIRGIGEELGRKMLELLEKEMQVPGIEITSDHSNDTEFIRNSGEKYLSEADDETKGEIFDNIVVQLKEQKAKAGS